MNFTGKEWKSLRERNRNCGYVDLFFAIFTEVNGLIQQLNRAHSSGCLLTPHSQSTKIENFPFSKES